MKTQRWIMITLILAGLLSFGWFAASSIADDHPKGRGHFEREDQHRVPFLDRDNEGNETAGQIAAWLLAGANLTIAMSILIRWTNGFAPHRTSAEKFAEQFQPLSEKTPDVSALLSKSGDPGDSAVALAHVPLHILGPPGNGSDYDGDSHESGDSPKIQIMPHKPSKKRLSNSYSPGFLPGHNFGAGNWPYDCGLTLQKPECLPEQESKCRPLLSLKIHAELLICPNR